MQEITIIRVEQRTDTAEELLHFVKNCTWEEAKAHITWMVENWVFTGWERMFAAVKDGSIVGMCALLKTDYYPLPEIFPWVTCVYVSPEHRGQRISQKLIEAANRYAAELGFERTYIPTEFTGLYEKYGYEYVRDIINYGGGKDRLLTKKL